MTVPSPMSIMSSAPQCNGKMQFRRAYSVGDQVQAFCFCSLSVNVWHYCGALREDDARWLSELLAHKSCLSEFNPDERWVCLAAMLGLTSDDHHLMFLFGVEEVGRRVELFRHEKVVL